MQRYALLLAFFLAAFGVAHAQWEIQDSGTTADLRGVDVDGGVAWAEQSPYPDPATLLEGVYEQ